MLPGAFCNTFDLHLAMIGFESGHLHRFYCIHLRSYGLKFPNNYILHSLKIVFISTNSAVDSYPVDYKIKTQSNSAGADVMSRSVAFCLGLHCLSNYHLRGSPYTKG